MAFILSPNMSLPIASVGNEPGPNYAYDANSSFTLLDGHDHSPGKGVQITPAGLNINADLTLQSNNLTQVGSIIFSPQTSDSTLLAFTLSLVLKVLRLSKIYGSMMALGIRSRSRLAEQLTPLSLASLVKAMPLARSPGVKAQALQLLRTSTLALSRFVQRLRLRLSVQLSLLHR